jgi:uncharacterized protein
MKLNSLWHCRSGFATALIVALSLIYLAVPCGAAATEPDFIIVAGGPTGGLFSIVGASAAEILRKEFPKSVVDVIPGGAGPNLIQAEQKKITLGITFANNAFDAWNGRDPAKADKPIRQVRSVAALFPSAMQIWVHADSPIKSFKDLAGKKICPSSPGQAPWQAFHNLMEIHGMTKADIEKGGGKLVQLTWSEAVDALANRQIDAVAWLTLYPHSSMIEVEVNKPVRLLSIDQDKLQVFFKKYGGGFSSLTIPAGTYKGQKQAALTLGTVGFFVAPASLPEDVTYRVVKSLWTNLDKLKASHVSMGFLNKDTIAKGMALPLHPGALKFFKENNIPVGEVEVK